MEKRISFLIFLIFLVLPTISAIRINEVESNPEGTDSRNEWIELYSEIEINISDYKLINNDGDEILLNGSFSGYFVYVFNKQWLDNSDEKVFLYKDNESIDETYLFADNKNDDLTWQLCEIWEFIGSTKGEENGCIIEDGEQEENDTQETLPINDTNEEEPEESITETISTTEDDNQISIDTNRSPITSQTIKLNPKVIKSEDDSESLSKSGYAFFGFVTFCVLLALLFMLKRYKYKKNGFEE